MITKPLVNLVLKGVSRFKKYDPDETIALLGTSRGGTTLLAEIVKQISKTQVLWEPLRPNNNRECQQAGFGWHHILDASDEVPTQRAYMQELLSGEHIHWGTLYKPLFTPSKFLLSDRLIVKFVNANRILGWMTANFENPILLMTRNPFSVVASKKIHGGFKHIHDGVGGVHKRDWIPDRLVADYPAITALYEQVNTVEEVLAWDWCVDTLVALQGVDESVFVLTYEELICFPERTLHAIFNYLGVSLPDHALSMLRVPSKTASEGVYVREPEKQIARYTERLNSTEIKNIRRIVSEFGLHFYLESDSPSRDDVRIADASIPRSRTKNI